MKMKNAIGGLAIVLAVLSLAPSFVPGAMSIIGLLISLGALIVSIFSVSHGIRNHFNITLIIVILSAFFINDALRIWESMPMPLHVKLIMYGLFGLVVLMSLFFANRLSKK